MNVKKIVATILLSILLIECNKDIPTIPDEQSNDAPVCEIILLNRDSIYCGDTVQIKLVAFDPDGEIDEIKLFIDSMETAFSNDYYLWETKHERSGKHTIQILATDNLGIQSTNFKNITLLPDLEIKTSTNFRATPFLIKVSGEIIHRGKNEITEAGIYWSKFYSNPTWMDNLIPAQKATGFKPVSEGVVELVSFYPNSFSISINNLTPGTSIYYRAFAKTENKTVFGNTIQASTIHFGEFADDRDGKNYKTITIGKQIWMAENIAYIPSFDNTTNKTKSPHYYAYDYKANSNAENMPKYESYGVLYNWYAAKEVCPAAWRLPRESDWENLIAYINYDQYGQFINSEYWVGHMLKATNGWNQNGNGTNDYAFSALPGGLYYENRYREIGENAYWWTSDTYEEDADYAYIKTISGSYDGIITHETQKINGISVRCIKR